MTNIEELLRHLGALKDIRPLVTAFPGNVALGKIQADLIRGLEKCYTDDPV